MRRSCYQFPPRFEVPATETVLFRCLPNQSDKTSDKTIDIPICWSVLIAIPKWANSYHISQKQTKNVKSRSICQNDLYLETRVEN